MSISNRVCDTSHFALHNNMYVTQRHKRTHKPVNWWKVITWTMCWSEEGRRGLLKETIHQEKLNTGPRRWESERTPSLKAEKKEIRFPPLSNWQSGRVGYSAADWQLQLPCRQCHALYVNPTHRANGLLVEVQLTRAAEHFPTPATRVGPSQAPSALSLRFQVSVRRRLVLKMLQLCPNYLYMSLWLWPLIKSRVLVPTDPGLCSSVSQCSTSLMTSFCCCSCLTFVGHNTKKSRLSLITKVI